MIPPLPRRCGDAARTPQEQVEEALVYIFEIADHEGPRLCGRQQDPPERVLCSRCISRNALLAVGWTLNPREQVVEQRLGLWGTACEREQAHVVVGDA